LTETFDFVELALAGDLEKMADAILSALDGGKFTKLNLGQIK